MFFLYMSLVYLCVFSSGVYLYFKILMYVKCHEQLEIVCVAILNNIYYYYNVYTGGTKTAQRRTFRQRGMTIDNIRG